MIRINLAPPEARAKRGAGISLQVPEFDLGLVFAGVYLLTLLALGGWWWHLAAREATLIVQVQQEQTELDRLKAQAGQASKVKSELADLKKRMEAIQELTKSQTRPVVLFDALADVVPRDLWLTSLEERGTTLRIQGSSFTPTALADFMSNLKASGRFKEVDLVVSREDLGKTPRLVTFEVTCRFDG